MCKESYKYFWRHELLVERVLQHGTNLSKISYFCKKNVHVLRTTRIVRAAIRFSLLFVIPLKWTPWTYCYILYVLQRCARFVRTQDSCWTFRYQKCQKYMLHTGEINVTVPRLCISTYALWNSIIFWHEKKCVKLTLININIITC